MFCTRARGAGATRYDATRRAQQRDRHLHYRMGPQRCALTASRAAGPQKSAPRFLPPRSAGARAPRASTRPPPSSCTASSGPAATSSPSPSASPRPSPPGSSSWRARPPPNFQPKPTASARPRSPAHPPLPNHRTPPQVDLRCHGQSAERRAPGENSVESAAKDVLNLMLHLKVFPRALIGAHAHRSRPRPFPSPLPASQPRSAARPMCVFFSARSRRDQGTASAGRWP